MTHMRYDVVVVGAGPAGAIASRYAAINGAHTLLIEEHSSIGSPVQCTGLISRAALEECELGEGDFVVARMKGAFVYSPMGEKLCIQGKEVKAYVIDRKIFDRVLVEQSMNEGVDILLKTRFVALDKKSIVVVASGEKKQIYADVVIGADGIQSCVARAIGLPRYKRMLSGIQLEAPYDAENPEFVEIFTGKDIAPGFFAWAVPFDGIARIGLAKNQDGKSAVYHLEKLLKHPVIASRYKGSCTEHVLGGIPLGLPDKTVKNNVMLVGDAAGQVKPTTGGGIYMGAVCAKIAGEVAAKTCYGESKLSDYEKRWRSAVGRELSIGMKIHKLFGKLNDAELDKLFSFFNQHEIREIIMEYGDMDHPSILLKKLFSSEKKRMLGLFGVALKAIL